MPSPEVTKVETYEYPKTRRYTVEAGTRCASVWLHIPVKSEARDYAYVRVFYSNLVVKEAAQAWYSKWGPIPWDCVEILTTHVTIQVGCEFRVRDA